MTERDLSTLVRDHVTTHEPPFALSPDTAIGQGRRKVRTRRAVGAVTCAAVLAVVGGLAVPRILDEEGGGTGVEELDPATAEALRNYDPQAMPRLMEEHARAVLESSLPELGDVTFTAWAPANNQGQVEKLTPARYDEATGMDVQFESADRKVVVSLMHADSEAEGDARKTCAADLREDIYIECDVTGVDGQLVVTRLGAKSWEQGIWWAYGKEVPSSVERDRLWYEQQAESVRSDTFLVKVWEEVKAPNLTTASQRLLVPTKDLAELATDPELVIPLPD